MIVGLVVWLTNARVSGRWFNPASLWRRHNTVNELKKLLDVNDHDVGAHNDLGRILVDKGRHAEALPHMEKAIARMDEAAETNYFLGLARLHTGDTERGLADVERALEISPGFLYGEPRLALARWYTEAKRPREALEQARMAVKINTSSVEGWLIAGEAAAALGQNDEARETLGQARHAYQHLPAYLRLPNRLYAVRARRLLKKIPS